MINVSRVRPRRGMPDGNTMRAGTIAKSGPTPGPTDSPNATLDPQDLFGAGTLYKQSVKRQDLLFPWARFPWMLIAGPQLKQAPSVHNIWNMAPPLFVKIVPSALINQNRSNRLRSMLSHRIKLPNTGTSSTGGIS